MNKIQPVVVNGMTVSPRVEMNPVRLLVHSSRFQLIILALVHPILALAMRSSSLLATAHAGLTLVIGIGLAVFSKDIRKVGYVAAYIAGAEVLWRMTEARIFWEAGKYFTILILVIALLRIKRWQRSGLPLLFFFLLSASLPLTLVNLGLTSATRDAISFNLSGPLALTISAWYFSQITLDQDAIRRLLWCIVFPVLGIATLSAYGIVSAERIAFTAQSNFATSGGYGPNQVSAILGLGGGLLLLFFLMRKGSVSRLIYLIFGMGLLTLSALTFSRGGIYNAAIMMTLALVHYLRNTRGRIAVITILFVMGLVGGYLIFPRLNAFTGGMLEERFSSLNTTLRGQIAQADLRLWLANPLLGVGPGLSQVGRTNLLGREIAAHTEYTRLLAEHGTAGLLALLVMLVMAIRAYTRSPDVSAHAWVAALVAWPLMEMSHAAMRIVAISFLFGLAMVNWRTGAGTSMAATDQTVERLDP
jgi:hypothetical protein